jgi:hypothetical protein
LQQRVLEILVLEEIRDRNEEVVNEIKYAFLTADPTSAKRLWPQWFKGDETEEDIDEGLSSDEGGEWVFPEDFDPHEAERLLASLGAGVITGSDAVVSDGDETGPWV